MSATINASTLTVTDVESAVRQIEVRAGDDEAAHNMEDKLYRRVLEAIRDGRCENPPACAAAALMTQDMDFARWCA